LRRGLQAYSSAKRFLVQDDMLRESAESKGIVRNVKHRRLLPSAEQLEQFGTNGLLALIHDAIGHLVTPINRLPKALPVLDQIVVALAAQELLLKEMLVLQKGSAVERFAAGELKEIPSLSHSVVKRDLRFVSISESYARLFHFKLFQLKTMSLNELLHPDDVPRFYKHVRLLLKGKVRSCELIEWRATGNGRFVLSRDTLWAVGAGPSQGPEYIATVSERIPDGSEKRG
jgi:hypothetical protein